MKTKTCIIALLLAAGLTSSHAQDAWTQKADFGGSARSSAVAFSIGSKGYLGTGTPFCTTLKDFWEYDPVTNAWTQKADFGGSERSSAVGFSIGSKGYIGTGQDCVSDGQRDFWEYDPVTNAWTQKADFGGTKRFEAVGFSIGSKGYIGTGVNSPVNSIYFKDFWEYDPASNAWTRKADFGGIARSGAVGFSIGSKGYIGTGADRDFWEYDPVTNAWTQKADFGGTARSEAVAFSIGSKGYIGTGSSFSEDFWEYDPVTDAWTQKTDFGGAERWQAVGFSIDSKGYLGTGGSSTSPFQDFWEYTPATSQTDPVPLINQPLVPDAVVPGGAGFTLTVNGTGFVSGSVVNWNGSARATTFVNGSQLTASILASDIATASTASVTVVNPSPGGGTSNVEFFPITRASSSIVLSKSDHAIDSISDDVGVGDFNGDGKLDLAVVVSDAVSILLGNGDGTFQPPVDYATGAGPDSIVIGDFNKDGKLDLAVKAQVSNAVSVLLGNGDGTFQPAANYAAGGEGSLAVADFNADGNLDFASTSSSDNTIFILLGNGDGTFQSAVAYPTGSFPYGITVGDFNADDFLDLIVANQTTSMVSILLGNGDGTFQPPVQYRTGHGPFWVNAADLNADGVLDLVVPNQISSTVSILLGNGDGTFQSRVDYAVPAGAERSRVADLNGDGKLDVVVASRNAPNVISILLGNGNGTFQAPLQFGTDAGPLGVAVGDFNEDGRLDLAVASLFTTNVPVLLQGTTVALSGTSLRFGVQLVGTASPSQEVTLTNTGPILLDISSISASGDFLQRNNCGTSLDAGESCTIRITFKPTDKGTRTGNVTITDSAADSPQVIALTGTGTVVQLTPSSLDFGGQRVGTISRPKTVILTNTGSTALSIRGISITGTNFGDFVETTTCGSSVPAHASCEIDVRFAPSNAGTRTASMKVQHDGGGQQPVSLTGTGVSN